MCIALRNCVYGNKKYKESTKKLYLKDSTDILALLSWVGYKLSSLLLHNNDKNGRKEECKKALERGKEEMKIIFILTVVSCSWGSCMFFSVLYMLTAEIYRAIDCNTDEEKLNCLWMIKK